VEETFSNWKVMIDAALDAAIPPSDTHPELLHRAMRYGVFPGGKRLRPLLVLSAAVMVERVRLGREGPVERSIPPAVAIELIHSYSLVHDDLPSMDNDDFRRGLPTVHKAFGEAEAILAGDALLSLAFEVVSGEEVYGLMGPETSVKIVSELARASGSLGMVGGQVMDISPVHPDTGVEYTQKMSDLKTGALIKSAIRCGAIVACASSDELEALTRFGELFGRAFQVRDDINDCHEEGHLTFSSILGIKEARLYGSSLLSSAIDVLKPYEKQGEELLWLATKALGFS
jgi:geranylgeranyl diphosphate synthase type II